MIPTSAGGDFLAWRKDERAWSQDSTVENIEPDPSQDGLWGFVASGPQTPNPETSYNNSISFQVGYSQESGGSTSFGWSNGQSFTISDWGVSAVGAGNHQIWHWRSQQPGNTDAAQASRLGYAIDGWFSSRNIFSSGYPNQPNELCQTQVQDHSSVAWQSNGLQTVVANIELLANQHILDLWCTDSTFGALTISVSSVPGTRNGGRQTRATQSALTVLPPPS
jgi:hypothetical protein